MRAAKSDVLKIFVYLGATLVLAAVLAPLMFNFGKGLAEVTENKETNRAIGWIAEGARHAEFPQFFDRALLVSGLLLIFPLIQWLRATRRDDDPEEAERARRDGPPAAVKPLADQALRRDPRAALHLVAGFLLGASVLLLFGFALTETGAFGWRPGLGWPALLRAVVPAAFGFAVVCELLFRAALLGALLRALRPWPAVLLVALIFALAHFLQPQPGMNVPVAEARAAGFQILGELFGRLARPEVLAKEFAPLLAVGVVLGYARLRTGALWLPIGLHGGWVFAILLFQRVAEPALAGGGGLWTGSSLRVGVVPLLLVLATGVLVHLLTVDSARARRP
jgi:membrane protease YdiL (CAAX protease family)